MKTFLFDSLNRFRRYSKELDTMAEIRKCLCGKAWLVFNNSGDREVYIFKEDGSLIISINGNITRGSWQYLSENNSIAISASNQEYMVHPAFLDNILFALQVDGTENYAFLIDQKNAQNFAPRSLDDLHQYFRQKEQKRIEEENRKREEQRLAELKRIEEENRKREEERLAEQKRIEKEKKEREERERRERKQREEEQKNRLAEEIYKDEIIKSRLICFLIYSVSDFFWKFVACLFALLPACWVFYDVFLNGHLFGALICWFLALMSCFFLCWHLVRFSFYSPLTLILRCRLKKFIKNNRTYNTDMLYRLVKCHNYKPTSFDIFKLSYNEFKKLTLDQIPTNEIYYTTKDIRLLSLSLSGVQILSHVYYRELDLLIVTFDKDVTEIRDRAFSDCSSLTSISIPPSVTKIGDSAFAGCSSLRSISIPESVTKIGDRAFYGCSNLTFITRLESLTEIGERGGGNCRLSISILPSVTEIGDNAFNGCSSLTRIIIPESVTQIGQGAFSGCSSLTRITIPESVTKIEEKAFDGCSSLTSITIPESVTEIGQSAFSGCSSLTSITVSKDNKVYDSREDCNAIIHTESNTLIRGCMNTVILPSVTEIGEGAFSGCSSLTSISIPESVTKIGDKTFWGCSSLTGITIPQSVEEIGEDAFYGCSSLTSITVSKENKVYDSREGCNAIIHTESNTLIRGCENTIILPSVTEIGEDAFWGCKSLTSITIPKSVTQIGKGAFSRCSSLTSIAIPPSVTEIGYRAFSGCSSLTSITVSKDNKVYDSREDCNAIIHTESNTLISGCKNTIIPPSVKEIGKGAFDGCSSLTSISIPPSVTEIGRNAFHGCSSLTSITIPPSVTKIGLDVFFCCSSLTSISIPPSVTEIGPDAFSGCTRLTEVRIPKDCNVHRSAFNHCPRVLIIRY